MKFPKRWLKDVVVVQFHDNGYKGDLVLPADIKHNEKYGEAEVIAIGSKFRHKADVKVGDYVLVDTWLGTRRTYDKIGEAVTFDGEDIQAIIIK